MNLCFTDGPKQTGRQDRNLADFIIINKLSNFYLYRATKTKQNKTKKQVITRTWWIQTQTLQKRWKPKTTTLSPSKLGTTRAKTARNREEAARRPAGDTHTNSLVIHQNTHNARPQSSPLAAAGGSGIFCTAGSLGGTVSRHALMIKKTKQKQLNAKWPKQYKEKKKNQSQGSSTTWERSGRTALSTARNSLQKRANGANPAKVNVLFAVQAGTGSHPHFLVARHKLCLLRPFWICRPAVLIELLIKHRPRCFSPFDTSHGGN